MEIVYVCQYCGNLYNSKDKALKCEKEARKLKPKFEINEIVSDDEDYLYRVLNFKLWKRNNFIGVYNDKLFRDDQSIELPSDHCFEYELKGFSDEIKGRKSKELEEWLHKAKK